MISIIVSSVNEEQNIAFRRNIEATIGVECELLIHDNRQTGWGLCKLYNHYAAGSRYDILCFFHEDIHFHTQNWGQIIANFFGVHTEAGVVGFTGSTVKTPYLSGWGSHRLATRGHIIQHFPDGTMRESKVNPLDEEFSPVVSLDGLALITTKKVWREHPFDEQLFRRFHLYDLDFSIQVAQHYTNYVCHTILVEHFSNGSYTQEWFGESVKFLGKWRDRLPLCVMPCPGQLLRKCLRFDAYQQARLELAYDAENLGLGAILGKITEVATFPYKFKLIKYIVRAGVKHMGRDRRKTSKN